MHKREHTLCPTDRISQCEYHSESLDQYSRLPVSGWRTEKHRRGISKRIRRLSGSDAKRIELCRQSNSTCRWIRQSWESVRDQGDGYARWSERLWRFKQHYRKAEQPNAAKRVRRWEPLRHQCARYHCYRCTARWNTGNSCSRSGRTARCWRHS